MPMCPHPGSPCLDTAQCPMPPVQAQTAECPLPAPPPIRPCGQLETSGFQLDLPELQGVLTKGVHEPPRFRLQRLEVQRSRPFHPKAVFHLLGHHGGVRPHQGKRHLFRPPPIRSGSEVIPPHPPGPPIATRIQPHATQIGGRLHRRGVQTQQRSRRSSEESAGREAHSASDQATASPASTR